MSGRRPRGSLTQSSKSTRISGACVACRSRKQKCSGEKPQCAQCTINNVVCEWPQQLKRGPPKQYTLLVEKRLFQVENLLWALASQVSDSQLQAGIDAARLQEHRRFGLTADKDPFEQEKQTRQVPSYWDEHTLDSAGQVRQWCEDRERRFSLATDGQDEGLDGNMNNAVDRIGQRFSAEGDADKDMSGSAARELGDVGVTPQSYTAGIGSSASTASSPAFTQQDRQGLDQMDDSESAFIW